MNIVFSADFNYAPHLETLLKSICCHHQNVHFYLLHKDFPPEWFSYINQQLKPFNSVLESRKIQGEFEHILPQTLPHISEAGFYRLLMQNLPVDKALYLDCDLIVNEPLGELYQTDISDYLLAAVDDQALRILGIYHSIGGRQVVQPYFNSGVMLCNLARWREENLMPRAYHILTDWDNIQFGDQDVLNLLCDGRWLPLNWRWNYQVGTLYSCLRMGAVEQAKSFENGQNVAIIHYTNNRKPWQDKELFLREAYWHYFQLNWQQIADFGRS